MPYQLEDQHHTYTLEFGRGCATPGDMRLGAAVFAGRFMDRLGGHGRNTDVMRRIFAHQTGNIGASRSEILSSLAQWIDQGKLSVLRRAKPKKKKTIWRDSEDIAPLRKGPDHDAGLRYDSWGYPGYLDGKGHWCYAGGEAVKRGSLADGSRPLDPHPFEVEQKLATERGGVIQSDAIVQAAPHLDKRITVVYQYHDGAPVAGACCSIFDRNNTLVAGGPILDAPETVFRFAAHETKFRVTLHDDPVIQAYLRQPYSNPELNKAQPGWFDRMAASVSSLGDWAAGVVAGDFNEDPSMSQIVTNTLITMIPLVDQAADLRDIAASMHSLVWVPDGYRQYMNWVGLGLTVVGLFPTVGSLAKGILKAVFFKLPVERLVKTFNTFAKGNANKYLKELRSGGLTSLCDKAIAKTRKLLDGLYAKLTTLKNRLPDFLNQIKAKITTVLRALDQCAARVNDMFTRLFDDLAAKLSRAMGQPFELAFESASGSRVAYRQAKQAPPVYKVEVSGENGYVGSKGGVGPMTTPQTKPEAKKKPETDLAKKDKILQKHNDEIDSLIDDLTYAKRGNVDLKVPGGVAGAIRHTKKTGELVGGSDHIQKGKDILKKMKKINKRIENARSLSDTDKTSLINKMKPHIDDLTDALK